MTLVSLFVWLSFGILLGLWCLMVGLSRVLDRDPLRRRTGYLFRKLGNVLTAIHPAWRLRVTGGARFLKPETPYVVVCNHQSLADIPFISTLPWEMKWLAKQELFRLPVIGWMMKWSADLPVDRGNARSGTRALTKARSVLAQKCPVMIFPEGTRTSDGRVQQFSEGAFHLAIRARVPVLPLALDGARECIPKHSWRFGKPSNIRLEVLAPLSTSGLSLEDAGRLRDAARGAIMARIATWRGVPLGDVDGAS